MKKLLFILMTLFGFASVQAQTGSYPHEVFDPLGIPQVDGAKLLHVDKGTKTSYPIVVYKATVEQVMDWIAEMDNLGFLHKNRYNQTKEYISRGAAYKGYSTIEYYFPVGTDGDKQSKFVQMQCRFDQDLTFRKKLVVPGATMLIQLTPFTHNKVDLNYKKGEFKALGITDESGFIPKNIYKINVNVFLANKVLVPEMPEGTALSGSLIAKFVEGYIPTHAEVCAWANKLYKACEENASDISPVTKDENSAHYWTYTYNGIKYKCWAYAKFDLFGQFKFEVQRDM